MLVDPLGVSMIAGQNIAVRTAIDPQTISTASSVTGNVVDCSGFDYMSLAIANKITNGLQTIRLSFGDTTDPSDPLKTIGLVSERLIDGQVATTPSDDEQRVFLIDLRTRPRFCRLSIAGFSMNGSIAAIAFFSRLANSGYTNEAIAGTGGEVLQG